MHELHTKYLFVSLLENFACDLILDIGALDGQESLIFKNVRREAKVVALEANPYNFHRIEQDPDIQKSGVEVEHLAIWCDLGHIRFNVTDVDHINSLENHGTSSILRHPDLAVREIVEVPCTRIDTFIASRYADSERVAIWMDIEGAEWEALEGISGSLDRILMIHVETSQIPMREGQKVFGDVNSMLMSYGFQSIGSNFDGRIWGDVLYVKKDAWSKRDHATRRAYFTARLMRLFPRRRIATFLFRNLPWLHQWLRRRFRNSPVLSGY